MHPRVLPRTVASSDFCPTLSLWLCRSENPRAAPDRIIIIRPEDLIYTVDEMPPWPRLLVLGMQHAMLLSVNLVLIVIVFRRAGADDTATLSALSLGMIALAISTVLLSWLDPAAGF